ncbi:MAG TPA: hypothetical protein PKI99_06765, partial [Terrimesophilobacter sp.]|nr:hypothetical protein [Terrimesophilobacter sp.]
MNLHRRHVESTFGRAPLLQALVLTCSAGSIAAQQCSIEMLSVSPSGATANAHCAKPSLSADGRWVSFGSNASNLVPGDVNQAADVFLTDRSTGLTILVSRSTLGQQANGGSGISGISPDGRYVAFRSAATNLDPADTDPKPDIYRFDRLTGETVLVSYKIYPPTYPLGTPDRPSMSEDGRYVAFSSWEDLITADTNGVLDAYVRDMVTGTMELISVGNLGEGGNDVSDTPTISWDGRYVAFSSRTNNWFGGNPMKNPHVYVRDRVLGTTTLVSYAPSGTYGLIGGGFDASISGDGTKVAFMYLGPDLMPSLFPNGTWRGAQVYVRDLVTGNLSYVGYSIGGTLSNFECRFPQLSYDGRFVAWESLASNLTLTEGHGAQDIFHRDLSTGVTTLVSTGMNGAKPTGYSVQPNISADGRTIAFASQADNLVPGDTGLIVDIFVRECGVASPTIYCSAKTGASGCTPQVGFSGSPNASTGGGFLICGDGLVGG